MSGIWGNDRSEFYYEFHWYWTLDFYLGVYFSDPEINPELIVPEMWNGFNSDTRNIQYGGRGYPNHISFKINQLKEMHPGLTDYGFIDADGNKTKDGVIELIPYYYFTNEYTTFNTYFKIDGKEYRSSFQLKVPGVVPPSLTETAQTVKVISTEYYFDDTPLLPDLDNEFGHREYEDMKLILKNGKTLRPHITGDREYTFRHLPPDTEFEVTFIPYYVRRSTGERIRIDGGKRPVITGKTSTPYWYGGGTQPVSKNKARVMYDTNLEQTTDTYVEWREAGSTSESEIQKEKAPVVNGQLIGILNGLDPDKEYEYRSVYDLDSISYEGEWRPLSTKDAEGWYEPEIYSQPTEIEEDESVTLYGAVLPGSGEITEQGFELWPQEAAQPVQATAVYRAESSHRFIPCEGISMSANLSDLTPGKTYLYRVYVKADGKTLTGPESSITIPGNVSGIENVIDVDEETPEVVGYYNLQGMRSERPFPGMNIVVYSNGKTEKRIFADR